MAEPEVGQRGRTLKLRELSAELRGRGHGAAIRTVSKDLQALGIENPLAPAANQRRAGCIVELPFDAA